MRHDEVVIDLRLHLDQDSGKVSISVLGDSDGEAAMQALSVLFRTREASDEALKNVVVKSSKAVSSTTPGSRLRPQWERMTCDIIK